MYTLFTHRNQPTVGGQIPSYFLYLSGRLREGLATVQSYLREQHFATHSRYLLVQLIQSMNVEPSLPLFEYHRKVTLRAKHVAHALGITTENQAKPVFNGDGPFYGKGCVDIVIASVQDVDLLSVESQWKSLKPLQVLRHPSTGLGYPLLDGDPDLDEPGIAIVHIDMMALMIQYRQWVVEQRSQNIEFLETPMQFVMQYPLGQILSSHLDLCLFNRMYALLRGEPTEGFINQWPIYLSDRSKHVDRYLLDRIAVLSNRRLTFNDELDQIATITAPNVRDLIQLPDLLPTRQIAWALWLSRLPIVAFLLELNSENNHYVDKTDLNTIRRSIIQMRQDQVLRERLPKPWYQHTEDYIEDRLLRYL